MNPFDYPMRISDYWDVLERRKIQFIVPFLAVLGLAVAIAFLLPPVYRSEATFLIQRQSVPTDMVATTVTSFVEEQIAQIRQRLLSRSNLIDIAGQFKLYPQELSNDPDAVVTRLRESVEIETVDVRASDPNSRGERTTAIAFTVAFLASDPGIAQAVTRELSERFLAEHQARRDAQAAEVSMFLGQEAEKLVTEINTLEQQLAGFKQEELRQLPELMDTNLRMFEKTEQDIENTRERVREVRDRINTTRAELSLTEPYAAIENEEGQRIMSSSDRLSVLTAEYLRASSRYSAQHPDIIRLSREIRVLAGQLGTGGRADELLSELIRLQEQLRQTQQRYSADHPEVQRLQRAVSAVQKGIRSDVVAGASGDTDAAPPDNPRYVALRTQLEADESNLQAELTRLEELQARLDIYENRLFQTPVVERDFNVINRKYENALAQYRELRDKQQQAELAKELESGESGEKFLLTGAAFLPKLPDSPNRIAIILLGAFFASATAIASVAAAEYLDRTVRNSRMIARTLGAPPLAVIPQMHNPQMRKAFRRGRASGG